jgi:hypothetical protein
MLKKCTGGPKRHVATETVREPNTFTPVYSAAEGLRSAWRRTHGLASALAGAALFAALLLGVFYER